MARSSTPRTADAQQRKGMSRASAYGGAAPNHLPRIDDLNRTAFRLYIRTYGSLLPAARARDDTRTPAAPINRADEGPDQMGGVRLRADVGDA